MSLFNKKKSRYQFNAIKGRNIAILVYYQPTKTKKKGVFFKESKNQSFMIIGAIKAPTREVILKLLNIRVTPVCYKPNTEEVQHLHNNGRKTTDYVITL